jgi:activating signal cointegrator 1
MKALSLTQPWATLVAIGAKKFETRSWQTNYRGPVVIHGAKSFPRWAREYCDIKPFDLILRHAGYNSWKDLPLGALLARCKLDSCERTDGFRSKSTFGTEFINSNEYAFGDYSPGRFVWKFTNLVVFPTPIACRGSLGLWEPPMDLLSNINL